MANKHQTNVMILQLLFSRSFLTTTLPFSGKQSLAVMKLLHVMAILLQPFRKGPGQILRNNHIAWMGSTNLIFAIIVLPLSGNF